jgi:dihydrofolate synthase / folylpolyglutamate synthase
MIYKTKLTNTLNRMFSLHPKLIDFDLSRLNLLMKQFQDPHNQLNNVIHIAGTNGKGSTASFLKEIFEEHGYTVNIYTSPHLINFNERIRIKKSIISEEMLINILEEIEAKNQNKPITFFEITTAAAFIAFQRNISDINIIETGLGGRLDATNIINKKKVCIITKIGFDHTEYLGNTIESIANEKAGILRENVPTVISKQDNPQAYKTLIASAKKMKANLIKLENISSRTLLGLKGSHQYENASSAYPAAK